MEECYFQPSMLLKLALCHWCFSLFKIVQMVPNCAKNVSYDSCLGRYIVSHSLFVGREKSCRKVGGINMVCAIWHHLYNFKNVKNTSVDISKVAGFSAAFQASASRFLNCTNGIK